MQIVIDIPTTLYNTLTKNKGTDIELEFTDRLILECAAADGTPLPKRHGRLIDADALQENCLWWETEKEVSLAPTIIEADKAESEG